MATFSQSTFEKGSDILQDFLCSACLDKKLDVLADFYCESCVKFYCIKCIHLHGLLFTNHSTHGRANMKKWPVSKKVKDFLLQCDVHKEENLAMFCKDHSQLCCNHCAFLNHRQCKTVMLLSDLAKNSSTDLKQVSVTIKNTLAELKELQDNQEASIRSVQSSFNEQLHKILETRLKIIAALDVLEKMTLQEMKDTLTKLQAPITKNVNMCATFRNELGQLEDCLQDISDKSQQELSLIASIKCQDKIQLIEKYQKKDFVEVKSSITFQPFSEIVQCLSKLSGLGRIGHSTQILTVQGSPDLAIGIVGKSEYYIGLPDDDSQSSIDGIYALPNGEVLVLDSPNNKVKLLNQQYQLVSHCIVPGKPSGMCPITNIAVGVIFGSNVQFIKVNNSQLVADRKLQLHHACTGISHHQGDMFVTSGTALYKYSMSGTLISKLHKDKSDHYTVYGCAVSPTGDALYITNLSQNKLLTLARDGSVLSTLIMDPELQYGVNVHVTPAGQVLVCGHHSGNILQVDSKGSKKLATLALEGSGVFPAFPTSVFYNSITDSIMVGCTDYIVVYKVK